MLKKPSAKSLLLVLTFLAFSVRAQEPAGEGPVRGMAYTGFLRRLLGKALLADWTLCELGVGS